VAIVVARASWLENFDVENWGRQKEKKELTRKKKKSIQERERWVSEQPSSTAEIGD